MVDLFGNGEPTLRILSLAAIEEAFELFWSQYPRRVAKGDARKAFKEAIERKHASPMIIATGARRYAEYVAGDDPRFIAYPATWLRAERWLDELGPKRQPPAKGTDALRNRLRTEIENGEVSGLGGEGTADLGPDGRFPRLTH